MTLKTFFATHVQCTKLPTEMIPDLLEACWMVEEGDVAGQRWCEEKGYPGYTSYASLDDLPERHPAFAAMVGILNLSVASFAEAQYWDLGNARLKCDSLWINILDEDGMHSGHIHPNSVISGTAYVAMPKGAGDLKFEDPRLQMMMAAPPLKAEAANGRFEYISPEAGDILLWESWLRHEVMANRAEDPRISVSFNYSLVD